ncbi:hypothetical protein ACQ4PT_031091 [Festuca glaucescens]
MVDSGTLFTFLLGVMLVLELRRLRWRVGRLGGGPRRPKTCRRRRRAGRCTGARSESSRMFCSGITVPVTTAAPPVVGAAGLSVHSTVVVTMAVALSAAPCAGLGPWCFVRTLVWRSRRSPSQNACTTSVGTAAGTSVSAVPESTITQLAKHGMISEASVANETPLFVNKPPPRVFKLMSLPSTIIKLTLGLLWCIIHVAISLFSLCSHLIFSLECYLISSGLLRKYQNLQLSRMKYLAIVVDSREAKNTVKINQLLCWLKNLGVKYVCLYDIDGVLKKLFEPGMNGSKDDNRGDCLDISANIKALDCYHSEMTIECISGSDGKEGIAKAANLLCSTYLKGDRSTHENIKSKSVFTETDMASALKSVGCGGPESDLLLVYGPARCHLGFPAWRLRYTEIMHMGPLKSMKYGAIVKAFYNFAKKHQNYGK